jgi:hypothetical protein
MTNDDIAAMLRETIRERHQLAARCCETAASATGEAALQAAATIRFLDESIMLLTKALAALTGGAR